MQERVMRKLMRLVAAVCVSTTLASCLATDIGSPPPVDDTEDSPAFTEKTSPPPVNNTEASPPVTEAQVPYYDVLVAYETGNLEDARSLARTYLARYSPLLAEPSEELDREYAIVTTLSLVSSILEAENQLPVERRMGADSDFILLTRESLVEARRAARELWDSDEDTEYVDRQLGVAAAEWIRASQASIQRDELEEFFTDFQSELTAAGWRSLDEIYEVQSQMDPERSAAMVDGSQLQAVRGLLQDYYFGLVNRDLTLIERTTGQNAEEARRLLAEFEKDYQEEGISTVLAVSIPELADENTRMRASGDSDRTYEIIVSGIVVDYELSDGTRDQIIISKHFVVRETGGGKWLVTLPQ